MTRRRLLVAFASVALLIGVVGVVQAQPTLASWTRSTYANATMTSGVVYPVTSMSCSAPSGLIATSITVNWTQPQITGNGLVPTSYTLSWTGSAGTGQTTVAGLSAVIPAAGLGIGSLTVVVYANVGTWQSPVSTVFKTVNTIAVLSVIVSWTCS
jgi:hypothetical protein